jgi:hypothetical protein
MEYGKMPSQEVLSSCFIFSAAGMVQGFAAYSPNRQQLHRVWHSSCVYNQVKVPNRAR